MASSMASMPACSTSGRLAQGLTRLFVRQRRSARHREQCRAGTRDDADLVQDGDDCPVPTPQQPMFELKQLQEDVIMKWAEKPVPEFVARLALVYAGFFGGVGVPVSAATFKRATEPVPFLAAASIGSTLVVTVVLLRLYLGWSFVGNRLLSATVEYEETGWYDGQVWVKTPQVLMRDRLLNNYTVLPAMRRIRRSLLASSAACVTSVLLLQSSAHADAVEQTAAEAQRGGRALAPARQIDEDEYWDSVAKYEPWALDDSDSKPADTMMAHMRQD